MRNDSKPPHQSESSREHLRVIVLGSTGSIGTNTLTVITHLNQEPSCNRHFEVVGLAAGSNHALALQQAREFGVKHLALATVPDDLDQSDFRGEIIVGSDAAKDLVNAVDCDLVIAAISGVAGLPAVVAGIQRRCTIALANKETLVAAGAVIMPMVTEFGTTILPIDSEHSAIFQALQGSIEATQPGNKSIRRIILTASGGPFRTWSTEQMSHATPEQALQHPTWQMGAKVTIDSASMANKALEMIEAHHLFGLMNERIDILVHPQSIVHGLVEFVDGTVLAQLASPDMRTPIQYALSYPHRPAGCGHSLDWTQWSRLEFTPPDPEQFPALNLGRRVISEGQSSGAIFNAANEVAVQAFLQHQIGFDDLARLPQSVLDQIPLSPIQSIEDVLAVDSEARDRASAIIPAFIA